MEEGCWIKVSWRDQGGRCCIWGGSQGTLKEYSGGITQGKDGILKVGRVASGVGGYSEGV